MRGGRTLSAGFDFAGFPDEIRAIFEAPAEGLRLDFKAGFSWERASSEEKAELAKDIAAFANSGGGRIVIGVSDGKFQIDGSLPSDHGFDPSDMGNTVGKLFQPLPVFAVHAYPTGDNPKVVVVTVAEFEREPHICHKGSGGLSEGSLYVRTTDGKSKKVTTAEETRRILRIAARKILAEAEEIVGPRRSKSETETEVERFIERARGFWGTSS